MKRLLTTLGLLFLLLFPLQVQAQGKTTCGDQTFCEKGRVIKKSGCFVDPDIVAECRKKYSDPDECPALRNPKAESCVCDFQEVTTQTCVTEGGVREAPDAVKDVFGKVNPPAEIARLGFGEKGISNILQVIIRLIYIVAAIAFVLLFLLSAVQLIWSGGDKEAVGKARGRITWAIIGLTMLSLAFVIFRVLETILGFKLIGS